MFCRIGAKCEFVLVAILENATLDVKGINFGVGIGFRVCEKRRRHLPD